MVEPMECTTGQVWPRTEELEVGKRYSCTPCGSGTDNSYCVYTDEAGASFDLIAFDGFAEVAMRVGRYRSGGPVYGEHFYHQNWYAYAAMFKGELTGCSFAKEACAWDSTIPCITLTCSNTNVDCPPDTLPDCPGYEYDPCTHKYVCDGECVKRSKLGNCCIADTTDDDDFYHGHRYHVTQPFCCSDSGADKCQSTEIFWNDVSTVFSCEIGGDDLLTGTARCYLNQEHTGVSTGFPYTCHVGNCVYNATRSIPIPTEDELTPQPRVSGQMIYVSLATVLLFVGITVVYATGQLRRRAQRIKTNPGDGFEFFKSDASTYSLLHTPSPSSNGRNEVDIEINNETRGGASVSAAAAQASRNAGDDLEDDDDPLDLPDMEDASSVTSGSVFGGPPPDSAVGALTWSNVRVQSGQFDALRGVGGSARCGAVSAILGPSGAGKSSLLRALGGRLATDSISFGTVRLGSEALSASRRRETMAFVPQEDSALPAALTVKEHLLFHATLRRHSLVKRRLNPRTSFSRARMAHRRDAEDAVRSVVAALDLEECAARTIGQRPDDDDAAADGARGISGGEARRVSVAAELLGEPSVVLLDEPTSRLDAKAALALAVSLRRVARGGAFSSRMVAKKKRHQDSALGAYPVVLASMHQPRAEIFYEALDSVYLLARGRLVWAGNVEEATALARQRRLLLESRRLAAHDDLVPPAWPIDPNPADMLMDAVDEAVSTLGVRERRSLIDDNEASAFRKAVETALQLHSRDDDEDDESEESSRNGEQEYADDSRGEGTAWAPAPVATQLEVLLERQVIRAARAPSLLLLHAGGSLAAALCLGSIDHNPPRDLGGAQRRVEAIFFALFFLALLALTAISAFRDDAVVANYERAALGGLYGPLAHFVSVVLIDAVALRLLPALIFAAVAYPLAGFRFRCEGLCVVRFASSLVLTALSSGFAALALGSCVANVTAANAIGALGVLTMALFGGVAVDVNSGEDTSSRVSGGSSAELGLSNIVVKFAASCNALYYAFRAAVIGEFAGQEDSVGHPMVYVIDADKCDPSFKPVPVDVEAILVTLDLPTEPEKADEALIGLAVVTIVWLVVAAIAHYVCSGPQFGVEDADLRAQRGSAMKRARMWLLGDWCSLTRGGSGPLSIGFVSAAENGPGGMHRAASSSRCCGCIETLDVEIPESSSSNAQSGSSRDASSSGRSAQVETANPLVMGSDSGEGQANRQLQQSLLSTSQREGGSDDARIWQRDDDGDSDDDARDLLHAASSDGVPYLLRSPDIVCKNVTLSVSELRPTKKACLPERHVLNVLDDCSFAAKPATVTALLGPSGAGKSSLLDVLAGRRTTGKMGPSSVVCVDGLSTTATERRRLSRYAPQDDVLPPRLTAAEHLEFHGRLRLPQSWSDSRKTRAAMREARRLGLTLANDFDATKVLLSRASGGQRRRITLATELVAKTRLFFCDEPTTGLDAATALLACRRLRRVSRRGVTVVTVLHQPRPEIFFDLDVVALVVKGKVTFVGSPKEAARHFIGPGPTSSLTATINPADAMLDAVTTNASAPPRQHQYRHRPRFVVDGGSEPPEEGGEKSSATDEEKKSEEDAAGRPSFFDATNRSESGSLPPIGAYRSSAQSGKLAAWQEAPSPWNMLRLLAWREARAISRDYVSLALHFVPALAIGALLGVVYDDLPSKDDTAAGITDRFGLAFIVCTTVGLLALSAAPRSRRAARLFSRERDALRDTAFPSFVASAFVGDAFPLRIIPPAALAYVAATLSSCCQTTGHKVGFVVAAVQLHYALAAVGRALGAIAPRDGVCAGCSALVLLFSLLLCGFFVEPTDLPNPPWKQIATVFPARYAYETLNAHMFAQVDELFIVSKVGGADVKEGPFTGTTILNCFGLDNASKALSKHVALGIFGLVADVLTAMAYKLFARERR